jgi:hypothetical protein
MNTYPYVAPTDDTMPDLDTRPPVPQTHRLAPESEPPRRWEPLGGYLARSGEHTEPDAGLGVYAPETSAPIREAKDFGDNPEATQ